MQAKLDALAIIYKKGHNAGDGVRPHQQASPRDQAYGSSDYPSRATTSALVFAPEKTMRAGNIDADY
ncbi:hypothetical protein WI75_03215 [Burkholderia ubonensis]|nr:hypothetical protein WI75_03215 [Burkholderia ubonensis]